YVGAAGSSIVTVGADTDAGYGAAGGDIVLNVAGGFFNHGMLDSSGGAGIDAGRGGNIAVFADNGSVYNTGTLVSRGGAGIGTGGLGAAGGNASLGSNADLFNSG